MPFYKFSKLIFLERGLAVQETFIESLLFIFLLSNAQVKIRRKNLMMEFSF